MCESGYYYSRSARTALEDEIQARIERKIAERRACPERRKAARKRKRERRGHAELSKEERLAVRAELYALQPYCTYCRNPLVLFSSRISRALGISFATIDHIVPISQGGTKELSNLTLACERCNGSKDSRHVQPGSTH